MWLKYCFLKLVDLSTPFENYLCLTRTWPHPSSGATSRDAYEASSTINLLIISSEILKGSAPNNILNRQIRLGNVTACCAMCINCIWSTCESIAAKHMQMKNIARSVEIIYFNYVEINASMARKNRIFLKNTRYEYASCSIH